ncbi:MAG: helix-turn-helix domain-containing protein [Planctomycetes bacterium]|nr:helix-turn-helix domain-containing protein [Planctomycetota bacterium]
MYRLHDARNALSRKQNMDEHNERLAFLADRWPQAEIARKTGTQRNNISRYMRGGKMPLEFGAALVRKLGVNPAWLLVGEGTAFLSDVNAETGRMAGDLLELVEAMNSVASLQLGSLTGKHHLRMLRELNDALARFEKLRDSINERTGPIFARILDDYWGALEKWQLDKADDIRKAAEQVARLCDDEALQERFERTLSYHAFLRRDEDESIMYQSRVFLRRLAGGNIDEAAMREAFNAANTLQSNARLDEALAICDAAIALAGPRGRNWAVTRLLNAMGGYILMERGDIREGLRRVVTASPQPVPGWHTVQHSMLIRGLLLSGGIDFPRAVEMRGDGPAHAQGMLVYALWLEDAAAFKLACEHYLTDESGDFNVFMSAALDAFNGRKTPALKLLKNYPEPGRKPVNEQFDQAVFGTALARLCGSADARKRHEQSGKVLRDADARVHMSALATAMFHRNALALHKKGDARAEAESYFREGFAKGYGCFREIVDSLE